MAAPGESRSRPSGVRLAEMVGTLSLAADLGLGQPMEHLSRSCLLACRLGERMGLDEDERSALYYVTLLGFVGCVADSADVAPWFGDDLSYRAGVYDIDMKPIPFLGYLLSRAGSGGSPAHRAGVRATILATGARRVQDMLRSHCQVTATIAGRLGLGQQVIGSLQQIFGRWDGKGLPAGLGGEQLTVPVRLWHLADVVEVHHRHGGLQASLRVARERRGTQFAPAVVDAFVGCAHELFAALPEDSSWEELIAAEPALRRELTEAEFDDALGVLADYADLKSTFRRGHSRGVAELSAAAARRLGLPGEQVALVRRAALVHDLGRTGVPNTIWDKPAELSRAERERARLHPYYTERMLARPARLAELGAVAALAHERLDGSGYHRGLTGTAIGMPARLLGAAEAYHSRLEPRAYRLALTSADAAAALQADVRTGRLDADVVDAVLAAAGHRIPRRPTGPAGMTARECEVLALLARGASNRQIARELRIAPKTVGNHIEHIYAKAGVTSRTAATLFAMQHGVLRCLDPLG